MGLLCEFAEHRKPVTGVLPDISTPSLVHSCSLDGTVLTFDLRRECRKVIHSMMDGSFTSLSQRVDNELELVTSGGDGRIFFWDADIAEPVAAISDSNTKVASVSISPSGRFCACTGSNQQLKIYEVNTGNLVASGSGHFAPALCVQWSPDEKQLVTCANNSSLC